MLRSIATIILLTLTLGIPSYGITVPQQDQQQQPNRLKENPGKSDNQHEDASTLIDEDDSDVADNVTNDNDDVEVEPETVEKSESVNKYNFIFYFLYKFKYEDSRDEGILTSFF